MRRCEGITNPVDGGALTEQTVEDTIIGKRDGRGSLRDNVRIRQCTSLAGLLLAIFGSLFEVKGLKPDLFLFPRGVCIKFKPWSWVRGPDFLQFGVTSALQTTYAVNYSRRYRNGHILVPGW